MKRLKLTLGYLFIVFVFTFSCRPEGEIVRADLQSFTEFEQAKIGKELSNYIVANPNLYNLYRRAQNQTLYRYLDSALATIVNTSTVVNRDKFAWEVFVLRDEESKIAFTLPGGKIFISSAFLKFIRTEAQLLAVLSHEMCYADHGLAMEKLQEYHSGLILGDIVFNNPVNEKDDMVQTLLTERYGMAKVLQADLYSIELLCPFNYEADGIFTVLNNVTDETFPLEWEVTRPSYNGRTDTIMTRSAICGIATNEEATRYRDNVLNLLD